MIKPYTIYSNCNKTNNYINLSLLLGLGSLIHKRENFFRLYNKATRVK